MLGIIPKKQPFIVLDGKECGTMFVLAITVQLSLICLSAVVTLAEKTGRFINKGNLGVVALVLVAATFACFWIQFGSMMRSPEVNIVLGLLQLSSLYTAVVFWSKLRNDKVA